MWRQSFIIVKDLLGWENNFYLIFSFQIGKKVTTEMRKWWKIRVKMAKIMYEDVEECVFKVEIEYQACYMPSKPLNFDVQYDLCAVWPVQRDLRKSSGVLQSYLSSWKHGWLLSRESLEAQENRELPLPDGPMLFLY